MLVIDVFDVIPSIKLLACFIGNMLRYVLAIERSTVTFTCVTEIIIPVMPPFLAAPCGTSTMSRCKTDAIFFAFGFPYGKNNIFIVELLKSLIFTLN